MASGGDRRSLSDIFTNLWSIGKSKPKSHPQDSDIQVGREAIPNVPPRVPNELIGLRAQQARNDILARAAVVRNDPPAPRVQAVRNEAPIRIAAQPIAPARAQPVAMPARAQPVATPARAQPVAMPARAQPVAMPARAQPVAMPARVQLVAPAHAQPLRYDAQAIRALISNELARAQPVRNDAPGLKALIPNDRPQEIQSARNDGQPRGQQDGPRGQQDGPRRQQDGPRGQVQPRGQQDGPRGQDNLQGQRGRNNRQNQRNGPREPRNYQDEVPINAQEQGDRRQGGRGRNNQHNGPREHRNYNQDEMQINAQEQGNRRQGGRGRNNQQNGPREHRNYNPDEMQINAQEQGNQRQGGRGRNNQQNGRREHRNYNQDEMQINAQEQGNRRQDGRGRHREGQNGDRGQHRGGQGGNNTRQEGAPQGNVQNRGTNVYQMHYRRLEEVSMKDPADVILVVANNRNGFPDLLKKVDLNDKPDMIVLIMRVLAKVCLVEFEANKVGVLSMTCNTRFLEQLTLHLANVHSEKDKRRKDGLNELFQNCVIFYETTIDLLPRTACERLLTVLMMTNTAIQYATAIHNIVIESSLTSKLSKLEEQLKVLVKEQENKHVKITSKIETLSYLDPPDDFRDLSIFPTSADILTRERAFIRPNVVKGAYSNIEHYLDVQFRLLREDFVSPFRDGVCDYVSLLNDPKRNKKKTDNIRIYHNVRFEGVKVVSDNMGLVVSFQTKTRIKWEYSKRFMFGSLLCFTRDNFRNVLFGTVLDRDLRELEKGRIVVKLSEGSEFVDEMFQFEFIMAESEVYFEPYYHVLKALQKMKRTEFPMSKYIVFVESRTNPPQYVLNAPNRAWDIQGFRVPVLVDRAWPSAEQLALNDSQLQAFKSALTKEFVVIQGPPGTGKTYLGLKIARTLLLNANNILGRRHDDDFDEYEYEDDDQYEDEPEDTRRSPMLVVCFTNHALDQFLEGLILTTKNIVRVGGQSKNEALKPFNLREKRMEKKRTGNMLWLSRDIRHRMSGLMSRIKGIQEEMHQLDSNAGIVSITSIAEVYVHDNIKCFQNDDGLLSNELFLEWLLKGSEAFELPNADRMAGRLEHLGDPLAGLEPAMEQFDEEDLIEAHQMENDFELGDTQPEVKLSFVLTFKAMTARLEELRVEIMQLQTDIHNRQHMIYDSSLVLENEMAQLDFKVQYFTHFLNQAVRLDPATTHLLNRQVNLWSLTAAQRWSVYGAWVGQLRQGLLVDLQRIETDYRTEARQFEETKQMEDLELMLKMDVVGMTTTCAARLQPLLQALKARIVIVEEAAEVMESHIIVSLTSHCQHLILIGDHQQLRPTTAVYRLAKDFNFDISLFERMLKNGLHCEVINVQHRMRPEISRLIVPSIYKELYNHKYVLNFKKVCGVTKNVFFLTHNNPEQETGETSSRQNKFEGDTMLALCRYLLLQGYAPDRITILTTYSGQMFYLKKEKNRYPTLKDVKMTIVDNFQGEENDIILLSLVRNNKENNVGFLKIENRVCVALSRAKIGMYIMGNMDNLTASNVLWPEIKKALDEQGALGDALTLRCQIHCDQLTKVRSAEDFNQVPEGGCRLLCDTQLLCGHRCKSICHAQDRAHLEYKCPEPCMRTPTGCVLEHPCPGRCYADCGPCEMPVERRLPCGHRKTLPCYVDHLAYKCEQKVSVTPSDCFHTFDKPCYRDLTTYPCPIQCPVRLDCGHSCSLTCHVLNDPDHLNYKCKKPCTKMNAGCSSLKHPCSRKCHEECGDCLMMVKKSPPTCEHLFQVACSLDPATIVCEKPCKRTLPCGHPCRMKCCLPCGNCDVKVKKMIPECGHEVQIKCSEDPVRRHCKDACKRTISCGHRCTRACKTMCSTRDMCEELVPSRVVPACGHRVQVPCRVAAQVLAPDSPQLLSYCNEPCGATLTCGHPCSGSCGACLQGRIHWGCQARCGRTLICSHPCTVPCTEACPPCKERCRFRCQHSQCMKFCGIPCNPCKERCPWRCEHLACTKRCGDMCDREPCYEPCKKRLLCGHPCIGFCGEPCPPLCRVCNKDEVEEVFFGNEDEEDARFVYLADCKHTMESTGLEQWLNQSENGEMVMPKCPRCKSDIMITLRFMNRIKQVFKDICEVKLKVYGEQTAIERSKGQLAGKLNAISTGTRCGLSQEGQELYNKFQLKLQPIQNKRRAYMSSTDVELMHLQIDIFTELQDVYNKTYFKIGDASLKMLTQYLGILLSAVTKRDRLSEQELTDFNMEARRFGRIAELCQLETTMNAQPRTTDIVRLHNEVRGVALALRRYTRHTDDLLKVKLQRFGQVLKASLTITDAERKEIVRAMKDLKQGSWFKCPNGHLYAIGECGGAMEQAKCPECGATIGGANHALQAGNRFAPEMDGATHTAWPGTAMMPQ